MCSFGYVITDDTLNVIEKKDIIINPKSKFEPRLLREGSDATLPYPKFYYEAFNPFPSFYEEIKNVLTKDYKAIFGFAVHNDLKYIHDSTTRYKLDEIKIKAYDVRDISVAYNKNNKGLKGSLEDINEYKYKRLENHSSVDDAMMTMCLLKEITEKLEVSVDDVIELSNVRLKEYTEKIKNEKQVAKKKNKDPELLAKYRLFNTYKDKKPKDMEIYNNKEFYYDFSKEIKKEIDLALNYVEEFYNSGKNLVSDINKANFIIAKDSADKARLESILDTKRIEVLLLSDF